MFPPACIYIPAIGSLPMHSFHSTSLAVSLLAGKPSQPGLWQRFRALATCCVCIVGRTSHSSNSSTAPYIINTSNSVFFFFFFFVWPGSFVLLSASNLERGELAAEANRKLVAGVEPQLAG